MYIPPIRELEDVTVFAGGTHGMSGLQSWDGATNFPAAQGQDGRHGRDASWPTPGTDGQDIRVRMSYAADSPGCVQVFGEGALTASRWEITRDQMVHIDVGGGNGGNGGHGENGQEGGQGFPGRDATKHRDATAGGPGFRGGNGGRGTNGANAGNAGNAYITVGEDDLDTLVALTWNIQGGRGGASGVHGDPGEGGRGGLGGAGCTWSETHSHTIYVDGQSHTKYYTTHHSRGAGPLGNQGPPGIRPNENLYAGQSGRNGVGHIKVLRNDLTEGNYNRRYYLVVKSFDVVDENRDGINEPGEYLHVENIVVENQGGMPSPKGNILKVLIQPTEWLEPVAAEALELPREIRAGATVRIPGMLRAYIKPESTPRGANTDLYAEDAVRLVAFFERLQRPLPEFSGEVRVAYQYPLQMDSPMYLDCVAKGQVVRFSWKIKNISTKPYGSDCQPFRPGGTRLSDPGGVFDLAYADAESPHEVNDMLDVIDPGDSVPVTQDFHVSQFVQRFSSGQLRVSLLLSDPHNTGHLREIKYWILPMQISAAYSYNPKSRFLMVMNASTPNSAILQTISFIENGLHAEVDLFNLSLTGSFINPETGENVLNQYQGKSIVIFGNAIQNYFQNGSREPWDLLDPWETCHLANSGMNFLFINTGNTQSLQEWSRRMMFPAYSVETPSDEDPKAKPSALIKTMRSDNLSTDRGLERVLSFPVKKPLFGNLEKALHKKAISMQAQLDKKLPLRRATVVPADSQNQDPKAKTGSVVIIEGLPHHAKLVAGVQAQGGSNLPGYNVALITHSLPFKDQCAMFWNMLDAEEEAQVSVQVAYRGDVLKTWMGNEKFSETKEEQEFLLDAQARSALAWSIATQLNAELSRFCLRSPWPDSGFSKSTIVTQLPLLQTFMSSAPQSVTISSASELSSLIAVLGPVMGAYNPMSFGQWLGQNMVRLGNRRAKVRSIVTSQADTLINGLAAKEVQKEVRTQIKTKAKETKMTLKDIRKGSSQSGETNRAQRIHELSCRQLAGLCGMQSAGFVNLNDTGTLRSWAPGRGVVASARQEHAAEVSRMGSDAAWSAQRLAEMVNPEDAMTEATEESDVEEVPLPEVQPGGIPVHEIQVEE